MPAHLTLPSGSFGEHTLLVGDPARAALIADELLDGAQRLTDARGLLGFVGTFNGTKVGVQTTGMGGPSVAIVIEELIQLGARRLVRLGTCGSLADDVAPGDFLCAASAIPADGTSQTYVGGEPHAPLADFEIVHAAVHDAKHAGIPMRVGLVATTDAYYDPGAGRAARWAARGALAVDMETAPLLTIAPLRNASAASFLVVANRVSEPASGLSPDERRDVVLRCAPVALGALVAEPKHR
jgi:DeoD family purine-nucleoside phosphorylase